METRDSLSRPVPHPQCFVCSEDNSFGLKAKFIPLPGCGARTEFIPHPQLQGYEGKIHGGIITCLLDGAMCKALLFEGIKALTGKLSLRFKHPILIGQKVIIESRLIRSSRGCYWMEGSAFQQGSTKILAKALFIQEKVNPSGL